MDDVVADLRTVMSSKAKLWLGAIYIIYMQCKQGLLVLMEWCI